MKTSHKITFTRTRGFTLIELLIGIAIIGIMAGMVLYTLAGAQEDAKRAKTRATIQKLNSVILHRFEEYRYRSVKFPVPRRFMARPNLSSPPPLTPRRAATIRTILLKDLMRMEMPDRQSDLKYTPTNFTFDVGGNNFNLNDFGGRYCSREYNVLRNYFNLEAIDDPLDTGAAAVLNEAILDTNPSIEPWSSDWESAECLYAIVAHSMIAGSSALENFHASEISDVDGDGFPEFIDAWGKPIGWFRWPAGYTSVLNESYKGSPDVFDPFKTHTDWTDASVIQKPWVLVPLIISSGPDGEFGVGNGTEVVALTRDPFDTDFASITSASANSDNITNHDILLE